MRQQAFILTAQLLYKTLAQRCYRLWLKIYLEVIVVLRTVDLNSLNKMSVFWRLMKISEESKFMKIGQGVWPQLRKRSPKRSLFWNGRKIRVLHIRWSAFAPSLYVDSKFYEDRLRRVAVIVRLPDTHVHIQMKFQTFK